jgi:hypothetical protein
VSAARALLGIGLICWLAAGTVSAGALVAFPNVSEQPPARLLGYLAQLDGGLAIIVGGPAGGERYPPVVVPRCC